MLDLCRYCRAEPRLPSAVICRSCWERHKEAILAEAAARREREAEERRRRQEEAIRRRPVGPCWTCGQRAPLMGDGRYCSLECWERGGRIARALRRL